MLVGATSFGAGVFESGLLSPPLFPTTAGPLDFGNLRNPIRSAGTGGDFTRPKIMVNADGEIRKRTRPNATTMCSATETASGRDGRRRRDSASGCLEERRVFI